MPAKLKKVENYEGKEIDLPSVSKAELATILHGLRLIQENANGPADCTAAVCEHFDEVEAITDDEIDSLIARLESESTAAGKR